MFSWTRTTHMQIFITPGVVRRCWCKAIRWLFAFTCFQKFRKYRKSTSLENKSRTLLTIYSILMFFKFFSNKAFSARLSIFLHFRFQPSDSSDFFTWAYSRLWEHNSIFFQSTRGKEWLHLLPIHGKHRKTPSSFNLPEAPNVEVPQPAIRSTGPISQASHEELTAMSQELFTSPTNPKKFLHPECLESRPAASVLTPEHRQKNERNKL